MSSLPDLKELLGITYRHPMRVRELMVRHADTVPEGYYLCPRCRNTLEREFMLYCDSCGQRLDWSRHAQAKILYPGGKKRKARAKKP